MIDSKNILASAHDKVQGLTPSVLSLAMVLDVPADKLAAALDNDNTAVYMAAIVAKLTALETARQVKAQAIK